MSTPTSLLCPLPAHGAQIGARRAWLALNFEGARRGNGFSWSSERFIVMRRTVAVVARRAHIRYALPRRPPRLVPFLAFLPLALLK